MLGAYDAVSFLGTRDAERSLAFFRDVLGLRLVRDDSFALVFEIHGRTLRVSRVGPFQPAPFTALGWEVPDIRATVAELSARGVTFERYAQIPGDDLGIWTAPDGSQVAWFKDPDGNTLSLTQHAV